MSFNITGLTAYVDQQRLPLITKAVFQAKTVSLFTKQVGIKSAAELNLFDTNAALQAASSCAWNVAGAASGSTAFTQRRLTVLPIKVQEELCPRTLEQYWMQNQLQQGSNYTGVPFEQAFAEQKALRIAEAIETAIWQGNAGVFVTGLNPVLQQLSGTLANGNPGNITTGVGITSANVSTIFQNQYTAIPAALVHRDDLICFCGWDVFRLLVNALVVNNWFHWKIEQGQNGELYYPGTNMRVVAVNGLNGTNRIFTSFQGNFWFGTDMLGDEEQFKIWESRDNDQVRFQAAWKMGSQVAWPDQIVGFFLRES
jgi:hypothetical protein